MIMLKTGKLNLQKTEKVKSQKTEKAQKKRTKKGAEIIMECLLEEGVDTIFGYPGGAVIPLYDALYSYKKHFTHILTAHEQGATHGADGYARSTGKTGVVFATSGPGATNTVTGIATAYSDSVPMVVITGQVASPLLGRDSFQEVDITTITMTVTKHNFQVRRVEDLAEIMKEAFQIAGEGRKGPVLVDVPKDLFMAEAEYDRGEERDEGKNEGKNNGKFAGEHLFTVAKMINEAEKPIIYGGGGVIASEAGQELMEFAEKGGIPVASSLMGLGGISRNHPLSLGLVGMHGLKENNLALCHSDLIITVGARFSDRVTGQVNRFGAKAKVIQLDIDACEVGKNKAVDQSIIGSLKEVLPELLPQIEKRDRGNWLKEIRGREEKLPGDKGQRDQRDQWSGVQAIQTANEVFPDAVVVTDVGQHQMWTAQYWRFREPRTFLTSGGLGTMGYGLGAAIGAKVGNGEKPVVLVTGDGSFRMNMNELGTVAKYNLPVVILLLNNSSLGMVRQWQGLFCEERYSETTLGDEVDFIKMAGAFGIDGKKVSTQRDLQEALQDAKDQRKPVVIECTISKDEGVYPIVPAGVGISEMIYGNPDE